MLNHVVRRVTGRLCWTLWYVKLPVGFKRLNIHCYWLFCDITVIQAKYNHHSRCVAIFRPTIHVHINFRIPTRKGSFVIITPNQQLCTHLLSSRQISSSLHIYHHAKPAALYTFIIITPNQQLSTHLLSSRQTSSSEHIFYHHSKPAALKTFYIITPNQQLWTHFLSSCQTSSSEHIPYHHAKPAALNTFVNITPNQQLCTHLVSFLICS
jgi:hypothetical protein